MVAMGTIVSGLPTNSSRPAPSTARRIANILQSPRQGDFIDFWSVHLDSPHPFIDHIRTTYYEHLAWSSHPLGKRNSTIHGAPFSQEWVVEHEVQSHWETSGRATTGWVSDRLRDPSVFVTAELARLHLRQALQERLVNLQAEAKQLESVIDGL
jgi:hypothetical protein